MCVCVRACVLARVCARTLDYIMTLILYSLMNFLMGVCVIVGGTEDVCFIPFVQLYEFLLLLCILLLLLLCHMALVSAIMHLYSIFN